MKVRVPVLLVVAGLLLLAVLAARGSPGIPTGTPDLGDDPPASVSTLQPTVTDLSSETFALGAGVLILFVMMAVLFGLAMLLFVLAGIRLRRRARMEVARPLAEQDIALAGTEWLAAATRTALSEMEQRVGGPPGDAVIAAWVHLERSAAATGIERAPHQTPTEFTTALLEGQTTDRQALDELRGLYQRARFGQPGMVTDEDATKARRALEKIS
jgi:hypothetical protein